MDPNIPVQPTQPVTSEIQTPVVQTSEPTPSTFNLPPGKTKYILLGVLILLVLFALGGGIYYLGVVKHQATSQKNNQTTVAVTPSPTPTSTPTTQPTLTSAPKPTTQATPTSTPDPTANWKIYTFPNTNVSIKYPQDWTFISGLQYSPQAIIISKQDSQSTGETRVQLEIGNIYGGGAGGASTFQHSDQFLINATNAYILTDNNLQPSIYVLSSCDAPKKCLFRVPNSNYQIDFYADHFTPGNQAVESIPTNDANISTAVKILKTVSF